ncbi:MAG: CopG family transcriptional regulator [Phycisphaerae bacterium]
MDANGIIPVDEELRRRVERLARVNGASEADLVREALEEYCAAHEGGESCYDRLERAGLIGCVEDAPPDLSTNPDHLQVG